MAENPNDNPPDLLEEVDLHLEKVEETTKAFTPKGEEAIDSNALISDDGSTVEPESDATSDQEPVIGSVESAMQALEALDEVEAQAADLTAQSVDALLSSETQESDDSAPDPEATVESTTETVTEPEPETEPVSETDPDPDPDQDQDQDQESGETNDDLLASIDSLLDSTQEEIDTIESLEEAVEELLEESESAEAVADEAVAEEETETDAPKGIDTEEVSEEVAEVVETLEEPEAQADELDELDELLDESSLIIENTESSAESAEDSIDLLDSALAEAADDMLDGDFEDEEGELVAGDATTTAIEQALEDTLSEDEEPEAAVAEVSAEQASAEDDDSMEIDLEDALSALGDPPADQESPASSTPEPAPPTASEGPVDSEIDDLLKDVADDLSETQDSSDQPQTQTQTPAAAATTTTEPTDQEVLDEISSLESAHADEAEPVPTPAWFVKAVATCRPKLDKIDPLDGKVMDTFETIVGRILVLMMIHAGPLGARSMILVSKPLSSKSPELRNAVGFIALWTAFLGVVLWLYVLMFRTPNIPQPESAPTRVINVDESAIVQPVIEQLP
ncbi:MAG: hypothetical protein ACSHX5_07365 [Phycisphaerales bacterium]